MRAPGKIRTCQFTTAQITIAMSAIAAPIRSHFQASKRPASETINVVRIT